MASTEEELKSLEDTEKVIDDTAHEKLKELKHDRPLNTKKKEVILSPRETVTYERPGFFARLRDKFRRNK